MFTAASPALWLLVVTTAMAAAETLLPASSLPRASQAVAPGGGGGGLLNMSLLTVAFTSSVVEDSHAHVNGHIVKVANPSGRFSIVEPLPGGCGTITMVEKTADLYHPKCVLAADAGYYNITDYRCIGNLVSDGRLVQTGDFSKRNVNLGIKNGQWVVGYFTPEEIQAGGFDQLIEGMGWIVHEGKNYVEQGWREAYSGAGEGGEGYAKTTSGRTALGFNAKGELLILQFDGHTGPPSWGATLDELADKMIEFGAVEAINLDGGGSTTMIYEGVEIGYSSDRTTWGALIGKYDSKCPIGIGKGNLSRYECMRQVSTILCVHERPDDAAAGLRRFLPHLAVGLVAATVVGALLAQGSDPAQHARIVIRTSAFVSMQQFVLVILDAYQLCKAAQAPLTFSGFYIGIFSLGSFGAGLLVWRVLLGSWRSWKTSVYLPAAGLLALAGLLLAVLEEKLSFQAPTLTSTVSVPFQLLLCLSQIFSGCFAGLTSQASLVLLQKLFDPQQRVQEMANFALSGMVGMGTAPLVAVAMHALDPHEGTHMEEVGLVGPVKVAAGIGCAVLVLGGCPDLAKATDHSLSSGIPLTQDMGRVEDTVKVEESGSDSCTDSDDEASSKRKLILGVLVGAALRGIILSGMEAGTPLLLETSFRWERKCIGVAISTTLLASIPLTLLYRKCSEALPTIGWVKLLALVGLLGSAGLFQGASDMAAALFGGGDTVRGVPVLFADCLIFPCIYLADSLQRGIMYQHLLPEGSSMDSNHVSGWLLVAWLFEVVGAVLSRCLILLAGQNFYGLQQVLAILIFLLVSQGVVSTSLEGVEE